MMEMVMNDRDDDDTVILTIRLLITNISDNFLLFYSRGLADARTDYLLCRRRKKETV